MIFAHTLLPLGNDHRRSALGTTTRYDSQPGPRRRGPPRSRPPSRGDEPGAPPPFTPKNRRPSRGPRPFWAERRTPTARGRNALNTDVERPTLGMTDRSGVRGGATA